ncbi:autotransporter domain-containing protein [Bordetella sp. 02P26C-1]|uniref:autotransporter domain-containing protein n=1 Tax=Bordetella sp. 02P26C-1 TaxID=2683195 RepID=UPI0013651B2C
MNNRTRRNEIRKTALAIAIMAACSQGALVYAAGHHNETNLNKDAGTEGTSYTERNAREVVRSVIGRDGVKTDYRVVYGPDNGEGAEIESVSVRRGEKWDDLRLLNVDNTPEPFSVLLDDEKLYLLHAIDIEQNGEPLYFQEYVGDFITLPGEDTPSPVYFKTIGGEPVTDLLVIDREDDETEDAEFVDGEDVESDGLYEDIEYEFGEEDGEEVEYVLVEEDGEEVEYVLVGEDGEEVEYLPGDEFTEGDESVESVEAVEALEAVEAGAAGKKVDVPTTRATSILLNGTDQVFSDTVESPRPKDVKVSSQRTHTLSVGWGSNTPDIPGGRDLQKHTGVDWIIPNGPISEIHRSGTLELQNGKVQATGDHPGFVVHADGQASLDNINLTSGGPSFVSSLTRSSDKQLIQLTGNTVIEQNNGVLLSVNRTGDGMGGVVHFALRGAVSAKGDILDTDGLDANGKRHAAGQVRFEVSDGARWEGSHHGLQQLHVGRNGTIVEHGGKPIAGDVTGARGASLTFNRGANIGGSVRLLSTAGAEFLDDTRIAKDLHARNTTVRFDGSTKIGGHLSGGATRFEFNRAKDASIGGSVTLTDGSRLSGGSMENPIKISGDVRVYENSVLGGNLDVEGTLESVGGVLSPGNSIGKQTFGSIRQMGPSYIVDINAAGRADLVVARTGEIDVSKTHLTVSQENGDGGFRLNHDYTILSAETGKIVGEFASSKLDDTFQGTLVHLEPVAYHAQDVQIRLAPDEKKVVQKTKELPKNQAGALYAVAAQAGAQAWADAALLSTNTQVALDQLLGEVHAGTQSALLYSGNQVRAVISDRVSGPRRNGGNASTPQSDVPVWVQVTGGKFSLKGDGNATKTSSQGGGIFVGGEGSVGGDWRLGAALGYNDSAIKLENRGGSKADVNSYTAALYGAKSLQTANGQYDLLAGAAYTHHNIDTRRRVTLGSDQNLKSSYDAKSTQLFAEAGYGAQVGAKTVVGPYVGLAWTDLKSSGFKETGGSAALRGKADHDHTLATTLGIRGKTDFDIGAAHAFVRGGLGWRHTNGDVNPSRSLAFVNGNGASFSVTGASIARDVATLNLELGAEVGKNTTVGLSYNGQFAKGLTDNYGSVFMKVGF